MTPCSIAFLNANVTGSFLATPISVSNNIVSASKYLNTSDPVPVENIVFSIVTEATTSPLCTFTTLKMIVTMSCLNCLFACMPKILAPIPPDLTSLS